MTASDVEEIGPESSKSLPEDRSNINIQNQEDATVEEKNDNHDISHGTGNNKKVLWEKSSIIEQLDAGVTAPEAISSSESLSTYVSSSSGSSSNSTSHASVFASASSSVDLGSFHPPRKEQNDVDDAPEYTPNTKVFQTRRQVSPLRGPLPTLWGSSGGDTEGNIDLNTGKDEVDLDEKKLQQGEGGGVVNAVGDKNDVTLSKFKGEASTWLVEQKDGEQLGEDNEVKIESCIESPAQIPSEEPAITSPSEPEIPEEIDIEEQLVEKNPKGESPAKHQFPAKNVSSPVAWFVPATPPIIKVAEKAIGSNNEAVNIVNDPVPTIANGKQSHQEQEHPALSPASSSSAEPCESLHSQPEADITAAAVKRLGGGSETVGGSSGSTAVPGISMSDEDLEEISSIQLLPGWLLALFGWPVEEEFGENNTNKAQESAAGSTTIPPDDSTSDTRAGSSHDPTAPTRRPEPQILPTPGIFGILFDPRSCSSIFGSQHRPLSRGGSPSNSGRGNNLASDVVANPPEMLSILRSPSNNKDAGDETLVDVMDATVRKEAPRWFSQKGPFQQPVMHLTTLVEGVQDGMGLVIFYFLKDHFQLSPTWLSIGFGLITLPWVAKPAMAYVTDTQYIFGQRRKPYMVLASFITSLAYLGVGYQGIHSLPIAIFYLALAGAGRAFVLAALQGLIVESTDHSNASGPVSEFFWLRSFGALVAAYYGGQLLEWAPASSLLTGVAVLPLAVGTMVTLFLSDEGGNRSGNAAVTVGEDGRASPRSAESAWKQFRDAITEPSFYGPIVYLLWYVQLMPALTAATRVGPKGLEATTFALVTALGNAGKSVSRLTSAGTIAAFGVTSVDFSNLSNLIMFCGGTLLLPLCTLPFIKFADEQEVVVEEGTGTSGVSGVVGLMAVNEDREMGNMSIDNGAITNGSVINGGNLAPASPAVYSTPAMSPNIGIVGGSPIVASGGKTLIDKFLSEEMKFVTVGRVSNDENGVIGTTAGSSSSTSSGTRSGASGNGSGNELGGENSSSDRPIRGAFIEELVEDEAVVA